MRKMLLCVLAAAMFATVAMSGETLRVVGVNHPWTEGMKSLIPAFEKETGIKIQLEQYGEDQLQQKLAVEFSGGGTAIDVFMSRPLQEARMMKKNGWYEELASYVKDDAGYDFADYTPGSIESVTIEGFLTAIPLVTEQEILYYRKDLLEAKGIAVPTTFEELEAAAKALTDKSNDIAGFVARGQRSPLITQFSSYLYSFGGDFFDAKTMTAMVDTPEFHAAADFYGRMLREYGPPGVMNMSWPQAVAVFAQGKAALYTDASSIYANLLDPSKSTVADKTECAMFPKGPKAHKTYDITAWSMGMSSRSSKKDAAWKFIRYMTSKESTLVIQGDFANQCARKSTFSDPKGTANFPKSWVKAVQDSGDIGVGYDRPLVTAVSEARDTIGEVVSDSILGKDFKASAKRAQTRFQELLEREK